MACLIVTEGPDIGRHLDLERHGIVMIGRDRECTFQILDERLSRNHVQVKATASGKHTVSDFGSSNGTFVNEKKIAAEVELDDGDVVRVGKTAMVYMTDTTRIAERMQQLAKRSGQRWQQTIAFDSKPEKK
jgi:pSer/pThr/pTyr-binding forkhead associated (FHA) protein